MLTSHFPTIQYHYNRLKQSTQGLQQVIKLIQKYGSPSQIQFMQKSIQEVLETEICTKQLIQREDDFLLQKCLRLENNITESIMEMEMCSHQALEEQNYSPQQILDDAEVGTVKLIQDHLTQVQKTNNFYSFSIDFKQARKVKKIKIVFDEKTKKHTSFKMRVNVNVPVDNWAAGS